jgi:hypothetical protein
MPSCDDESTLALSDTSSIPSSDITSWPAVEPVSKATPPGLHEAQGCQKRASIITSPAAPTKIVPQHTFVLSTHIRTVRAVYCKSNANMNTEVPGK